METVNHECYTSLEVAKLLKKAGFDWGCDYHYLSDNNLRHGFCNNDPIFKVIIAAPTIDVAQKWLREEKHLSVEIKSTCNGDSRKGWWLWTIHEYNLSIDMRYLCGSDCYYQTYEQALEAGIKKCLTLILEEDE